MAIFGGIAGVAVKFMRDKSQLKEALDGTVHKLTDACKRSGELASDNATLKAENANLKQSIQDTGTTHALACSEWDCKRTQLTNELVKERENLLAADRVQKTQRNLVRRMLDLEGKLWDRRASAGTCRFRPLKDRGTPIFSVLNLKGGVGKTTVVAHLARAFSAKGYRVLLVDLDLQGSLSSLFLSEPDIEERFTEQKLVQHFLGKMTHCRSANLLEYVVPTFGESAVVPTSDTLAYAEMNLTMNWLLKLCRKDTRFLLRRSLHQKRISRRFDLVLIDCPPLINTCCVNALAASDFLLIPVNNSRKAAERVPLLLERLHEFEQHVNPHLKVAGLIFNRTQRAEINQIEQTLLNQIVQSATKVLGSPPHFYKTVIRENKEVREWEANPDQLSNLNESEVFTTFRKLACEIEERLPSECRRASVASE